MGFQAEDVASLVNETYNALAKGRGVWEDIAATGQDYIVHNLLAKEQVKVDGGPQIEWRLTEEYSDSVRPVQLGAPDVLDFSRSMTKATVPWRHMNGNTVVETHMIAMNTGANQILDDVKVAKYKTAMDFVQKLETIFFQDTPADGVSPFSLRYYVVKYDNNGTFGFDGGNPTNFSGGAAGLPASSHPNWKNGVYQYTNMTRDDFIRGFGECFDKTYFKAPLPYRRLAEGTPRRQVITNYEGLKAYKNYCEDRGDNVTTDADDKAGNITFRGTPVTWAAELASDTENPFYLIDWSALRFVALKGFNMTETKFEPVPNAHNMLAKHIDLSMNLICYNRRRLAVAHK